MSNILQAICEADVVIVDVSARNPNVYYELGLCHAIGQECRLLQQVDAAVPADLAGFHPIRYSLSDIAVGRDELGRQLSAWAKANDLAPIKADKAGR